MQALGRSRPLFNPKSADLLQTQADAGHGPAPKRNGHRSQHAFTPVTVHLRHSGVGKRRGTAWRVASGWLVGSGWFRWAVGC